MFQIFEIHLSNLRRTHVMNKHFRNLSILAIAIATLFFAAPSALAQQNPKTNSNFSDNLKHPLGSRQQALQQKALEAK
ncbi:MAG: hypothetical protein B6D41_17380, partial [Chloroflexi bacterium UTCFX4]